MIVKFKVNLDEREYFALNKLAEGELRPPADHLRYVLRRELVERGLLPPTPPAPAPPPAKDETR